jgi:hypothetical protein
MVKLGNCHQTDKLDLRLDFTLGCDENNLFEKMKNTEAVKRPWNHQRIPKKH